jgi:ABC-type branched-subunit amino acid transport system substrate-binding protein
MTTSINDPRWPETAWSPSTESVPGTPLGSRYLLEHPIGEGAFGRVWRGRRRHDSGPVAIKLLRDTYVTDSDIVATFLRERSMLQNLTHPNLVPVDDLVVEGDAVAVVMELIDGLDVRRLARRGGLDQNTALAVLAQVAHALAYIHAAGVLHRDIKPENILVTHRDGQPWAQLTDFGLAWVTGGSQQTDLSLTVGTPAYLAPELLTGEPYGTSVDVYALGVTGYEMLSGQRPFTAEHPIAVMRAHLEEEPPRPDGLTDETWRVIRACMSKDPDKRPVAAQLVTEFERLRNANALRLGIDFGTCTTSAVLCWPGGRTEPLLFDESTRLPSAVYAELDGSTVTGASAVEAARERPERYEPYPKLRLADGMVTMGEQSVDAIDLAVAVLRHVVTQAERIAGQAPTQVIVARPAHWDDRRRDLLEQAAHAAELPAPRLVNEALAAVAHLVGSPPTDVPVGSHVLLYDLGAASTATSVVQRTADGGFDLLASEALPDNGSIDVDSAVLGYLERVLAPQDPVGWQRLSEPVSAADRRAAWQLWYNVRQAKEALSDGGTASIYVPVLDCDVILDREQFDELAQPVVERSIDVTLAALAAVGLSPSDISATLLIGDGSRLPLVSSLLRQALGHAPVLVRHPEIVVAEGAAHLAPLPAWVPELPAVADQETAVELAEPATAVSTPHQETVQRMGTASPPDDHDPSDHNVYDRDVYDHDVYDHDVYDHGPPVLSRRERSRRERSRRGRNPRERSPCGPVHRSRTVTAQRKRLLPIIAVVLGVATTVTIVRTSLPAASANDQRVLPACGYKIAFLGGLQAEGAQIRDAARLAVEQYNAKHANCTVQLADFNTTDDPTGARAAAGAVADPRILGVVGPVFDAETAATLPVLESAGLAAVSPWLSETTYSTGDDYQVFHRSLGNNIDDSDAGARFLKQVLKAPKTFIVDDNSAHGAEASQEVRQALGPDAVADSASITDPVKDLAGIMDQIASSNATAVYYAGDPNAFVPFVKRLRAAKPQMTIVSDRWSFTNQIIAQGGRAAAGIYTTCPCAPPNRAGRGFATQFQARYHTAARLGTPEAFDATNVLLAGIANGKASRTRMLDWVDHYNGTGVTGPVKFKADGNLANAPVWVWRVVNGTFTVQGAAPSPATGDR